MTLSLDGAIDRVDAFMEAHAECDEAAFDAAVAADRELHDAALHILGALYLPDRVGGELDVKTWTGVAGLVLCASAEARARFVAEVLFDVAAPPVYAALASVLRAAVSADELARALVAGLASADARRRSNARALPYYIMGRAGDIVLDERTRAEVLSVGQREVEGFDLPLPVQ